ncbi:DUF2934 domain-containing protein [Rhizobiaceae bacterium BDR2-2]|uniref:DUF2934 domain-containing protein n=1 Tax=Ectorhizobium quercum TaxID=2965071 RepID=A0AAE3N1U7_9HYPH|nr:DUF2934 domain-containing protein [Ectorhizobium quercum]MCX8998159.1 DUF2934 domain-containing protein [Ectorhizobium quercum]
MSGIDEAWVRKRAHELWEAEGRPEGRAFDHWYAATAEFWSLSVAVPAKKPAAVKAAGKAVAAPATDKAAAKPEPAKAKAPGRKKAPAAGKSKA